MSHMTTSHCEQGHAVRHSSDRLHHRTHQRVVEARFCPTCVRLADPETAAAEQERRSAGGKRGAITRRFNQAIAEWRALPEVIASAAELQRAQAEVLLQRKQTMGLIVYGLELAGDDDLSIEFQLAQLINDRVLFPPAPTSSTWAWPVPRPTRTDFQ